MDSAVAFGLRSIAAGADIVDVGGESTRPGAIRVADAEEIARVVPVIRGLAAASAKPISVDTSKASVARAALEAGAELVNDVSGGRFDPAIVAVTAAHGAAFIAGHLRGRNLAEVHTAESSPPTVDEVADELAERLAHLPAELRQRTIADPGLGFGKGCALNLALLHSAGALAARLGCPIMVGPSRKRFLGELTGKPAVERDAATIGAGLAAIAAGAQLIRVHDTAGFRDALTVFEAVRAAGAEEPG